MRIKEVCERTGLTDRAIRLYMESGLITPRQDYNYMGRRSMVTRTAFADVYLSSGGGYTLNYHWSPTAWGEHAVILLAIAALLGAVIPLVIALAGGRRHWMLISAGICTVSVLLLLFMPSADAGRIHLFEFVTYRKLLRNTFLYSVNDPPEVLIKAIKFVPVMASVALSCIGFFIDRSANE